MLVVVATEGVVASEEQTEEAGALLEERVGEAESEEAKAETVVVSVERGSKAAQEGWGLGCRESVGLAAERGASVVEAVHRVALVALVAREAPRALA
jgi:hypothetical protein